MTILQLCNKAPYPANDGSSIAIYNLCTGLMANNAQVHLLAINTIKHFKPDSNIPADFAKNANYKSVTYNTNTSFLGLVLSLFSSQSYFVSRFYFSKYKSALIQTLQNQSFDVIQIEGVFMATYIPIIKEYSKAKIVLRAHNIEYLIWERHIKSEKNILKKYYLTIQKNRLKNFELAAYKTVDAIIPITKDDEVLFKKLLPLSNTFTCLTGVNLKEYTPVLNSKFKSSIFHFASMDWLPNIEAVEWLLKEVWPQVVNKIPQAQLILAGKNMPYHIKNNKQLGLQIIENIVHSSDIYKDYDLMLVPLWSGSGLRIKIVEGLAYGKAIISTSIGAEGVPYIDNKNMLIADTAESFTNAIIQLYSDSKLKQSIGNEARLLAEQHFDFKKLAAELLEFYKNIL